MSGLTLTPAHDRGFSDQLVTGYQAGATVYDLATRFKVHRTTVSQHLHRRVAAMRGLSLYESQVDMATRLAERPCPACRGRRRRRADAPATLTAWPPWPGCGSRSPRCGPRPAPTSVRVRPGPAARRPGKPAPSTCCCRRPAAICSLIRTLPACQQCSGNWTPQRRSRHGYSRNPELAAAI